MMLGASAWKMHILGLVFSGLSSLPGLAGSLLGQEPQMGYWPEHLHVACQRVLFLWADLDFLPTWQWCS